MGNWRIVAYLRLSTTGQDPEKTKVDFSHLAIDKALGPLEWAK